MRLLVCLLPVLPYTFNVHIRWLMVKVAVGTGGASTGQPYVHNDCPGSAGLDK